MKLFRLLFLGLFFWTPSPLFADSDSSPTHGISIFGDLKYPATFTHFDYVNPKAPKGGEVKMGTCGTFDSFNPFIIKGTPANGAHLLHGTLLAVPEDEPFAAYGYVAEKVLVAPDRKSATFTLNKKAKFSDGTPVTADDVIFSFHTLKTKGNPVFASYYHFVDKVERIDSHTVKFSFSTAESRELPLILGQLPVFSKNYYTTHDFEKSTLTPPVGCGPYQVKNFKPGHTVTYERVPQWWGQNLPSQKGLDNFDMTYLYYRDQLVCFEAFKAGEHDLRHENVAKNWATGYNTPAVKNKKLLLNENPHSLPMGMQTFIFNTRKPFFKDRKVREALTKAFDFEWANKTLFHGAYTRTLSHFANSEFAASDVPEGEELKILESFKDKLPPELFTHPFTLPITKGTGNDRKVRAEADRLLKEAGWVVKNGKRVHEKTGKPFVFEFLLHDPCFENVALAIQRNLAPLGIKMTIRTLTPAQYMERMGNYDYDMIIVGIPAAEPPGNEQRELWGSQSAKVKNGHNLAGVEDPVVDKLIELVVTAPDRQSLQTRARALDRVLLWNYYGIPNWHLATSRFAHWNKFGMPEKKPRDGVGFRSWWLLDAKDTPH